MLQRAKVQPLVRKDDRVVIHFDYDCFYASVIENENPRLKSLPLAVQQKQIIVTCNYEARRKGLHKLQLITEAKRVCPDVIIVLGEDLTRFRDASKRLYNYLRGFSWNDKVERLGFDEVWMDFTDVVEYNADLLNSHDLEHSFFQLRREDPTVGFAFDAEGFAGRTYPSVQDGATNDIIYTDDTPVSSPGKLLHRRLLLGSHLALHLRKLLDEHQGYTCTVGISTSRILSKLVGNMHKPNGQTTLLLPYATPTPTISDSDKPTTESNVQTLIDAHDIGNIPYIGFKLAQKLREHYLSGPAAFNTGLVYGRTRENITVRDIRLLPDLSPEMLEKLLSGTGSQKGIGTRVYGLLHGVDDSEVGMARNVPRQISIEDSYVRLDTLTQVLEQLRTLSRRLLTRMRLDLTEGEEVDLPSMARDCDQLSLSNKTTIPTPSTRWIARPTTLRLTTRPRAPLGPNGTRIRTFKRISRSAPLPSFVFSLTDAIDALVDRLVSEALVPLFKKLHPEKSGWNLSLVNVAVTEMVEVAGEGRGKGTSGKGRDIGRMFKGQDGVLAGFRVVEEDAAQADDKGVIANQSTSGTQKDAAAASPPETPPLDHSEGADLRDYDALATKGPSSSSPWQRPESDAENEDLDDLDEEDEQAIGFLCELCGNSVPLFARGAHERFHEEELR